MNTRSVRAHGAFLILVLLAAACAHRGGKPAATEPPEIKPEPALPFGTAALTGTVKDAQGAPLPGVIVRVESADLLGGFRSTTSDSAGFYRFPSLPPGTYKISAELFGFKKLEKEGLQITINRPATYDPVLGPEGVEVAIEVRTHEDVVQPEKTQTSMALSGDFFDAAGGSGGGGAFHHLMTRNASSAAIITRSGASVSDAEPLADELLVVAASALDVAPAPEDETVERKPAQLRAVGADGAEGAAMPLLRTDVDVAISGFLARTEVRQLFGNESQSVIEAVYTFPLPTSAAIHDFLMEVAGRRIVGVVRPREEAERIYEEAKSRGQTASLLTQERPNVFNQNVANIEPGAKVAITITYDHVLPWEDGHYEYVFPMTVGQRYIPGAPLPVASAGMPLPEEAATPTSATDRVPDADRISPPVLAPGERPGNEVSLHASIEASVPIAKVEVPTHAVLVTRPSETSAVVELAKHDTIANRDFVLRYTPAGSRPQLGLVAHREAGGDGYFAALIVPPLDPRDVDVTPREITFVLDTSGSMSGIPIETSKALAKKVLAALRPVDRFNVIRFSGDTGMLSPVPLPVSPESVARAASFIDALSGSGGTEMLEGVKAYLGTPRDPSSVRYVCFLTDGFVGNEDEILNAIADGGQDARWFAFGIGSSVNRYLIEGIAEHGHGAATVVLPRDSLSAVRAAARFARALDAPILTDVRIDFGNLPVADVEPRAPALTLAGSPMALVGRYTAPARGAITVRGRTAGRPVEIRVPVELPAVAPAHAALAACWARTRIGALTAGLVRKPGDAELISAITDLAVRHHLESPFTSFVAVDSSRIVGDGRPIRILQPVAPQATRWSAGDGSVGRPVRIEQWGVILVQRADGTVRVVEVADGGAAAREGVMAGDVLAAVASVPLKGLGQLEALLLQNPAGSVPVDLRRDGDSSPSRRAVLPMS